MSIREVATADLHQMIHDAYQGGLSASHDAMMREHLRRSFSPPRDRRSPNRPFSRKAR